MSLSDCPKCWNTPCTCGHEWERKSIQELETFVNMLLRIIHQKKQQQQKEDWGR